MKAANFLGQGGRASFHAAELVAVEQAGLTLTPTEAPGLLARHLRMDKGSGGGVARVQGEVRTGREGPCGHDVGRDPCGDGGT